MRHERIPIEQKLRGDKCEPCEPAYGVGLNESHAPERVSMNAASTSVSALRNGSGNEMEWLMGEGMDDPLSSLLHMEQEAQGGTGDFGTLGDDLFGMPAPSGIFADNAGGARGGVPVKRDDPPPVTVGDSNSSGASGTSECTGVPSQFNIGSNKAPPRHVPPVNAEMETTLTRPFATSALRQAQLQRYRAKRLARHLGHKKIRYECRKTLADNRPRIKGRFAKVTPGEGIATAQSCPNLTALGKKAKEEEQEGKPQSSNDSTGGATKGRRSRLSGGSDANSGAGVKGTAANGRRSSGEATAETEGLGLGHLRPAGHQGLPYTQSEVSLVQLDRKW